MTTEELLAIDPITGEESSSYSVRLEKFEGPLDLLLYLIKKDEIDIYDIPIATITRQYLEYVEMMRLLDLDVAGEFVIMAATLIRIKSRLLLPRTVEEYEEDPREELILALLEYKKFKEAAGILRNHETTEQSIIKRVDAGIVDKSPREEFLIEATVFDLLTAFKGIMESYAREEYHDVVAEDIKLEDRIEHILKLLSEKESLTFSDLFPTLPAKMLVIVTLIAILELVKQSVISARQSAQFGEIRLYRLEASGV